MSKRFFGIVDFGHINKTRLTKMHKEGYLNPFDYESYVTCESCLINKMTKLSFTGKGLHAIELLELVHKMYVALC